MKSWPNVKLGKVGVGSGLGVNLVIDNFLFVASGTSPLYKFESNGDIAFWRIGGYECHLAANAVVLVFGRYQTSIATYLRGVSTLT